ncbi:hypothetical protein ACFFYR_07735 [Paraburkholderia dipogonis]|uniref:hypothetical protein n=1 Tax=Paraburkholderia dipogonis TaxID=1211383 RepID=UPI0035E8096B
MLTSLFKALDAGPAPINFNELYSALQTGVVEGQGKIRCRSSPRPSFMKCKKYISLTSHVVGTVTGFSANRAAWERLPAGHAPPSSRANSKKAAMLQRAARHIAKLSSSLRDDLKAKGITFIDVDRESFRAALGQDEASYHDWKSKIRRRSLGSAGEVRRKNWGDAMISISYSHERPAPLRLRARFRARASGGDSGPALLVLAENRPQCCWPA